MSKDAVEWAMDKAPMPLTEKGKPDTTARHVLQVLAEHAHPDGSEARPSIMRIQYRTGYDRRTVQRALRRLEDAGLIRPEGTKNGCTVYQLALKVERPASDWAALETEEQALRRATAERVRRHRAKSVTHADDVTDTHSDDVTGPDVTHSDSVTEGDVTHSASVCNALKVRSVTHGTPPEPTTSEPTTEPKDSCSPPEAANDAEGALFVVASDAKAKPAKRKTRTVPTDDPDFDEWYAAYPRHEAKDDAAEVYRETVAAGVSKQKLLTAAHAYATSRRGEDPKFTKLPAGWLRARRYNDELTPARPVLRSVSGGYPGPFQQPSRTDRANDQGL